MAHILVRTNPSYQSLVQNYMTELQEVEGAVLLLEARFGDLRESLTFLRSLPFHQSLTAPVASHWDGGGH